MHKYPQSSHTLHEYFYKFFYYRKKKEGDTEGLFGNGMPTFLARIRMTFQSIVKVVFRAVNTGIGACKTVHFAIVQTLWKEDAERSRESCET